MTPEIRFVMPSIERNKVMIVDDSEIVLTVAQHALQSAGYSVVTHPRPAGCIALILKEKPDLLLVDVNMPGLAGDTIVKMLGSTNANAAMIVLLYSSLTDEVLEQKATASHAHGYIRKSESPQDLVRQVGRWLRPGYNSVAHHFKFGDIDTASRTSDPRILVTEQYSAATRLNARSSEVTSRTSDPRILASGQYSVASRVSSGGSDATNRTSGSRVLTSGQYPAAARLNGSVLVVDHEMVHLSELRRLLKSHPGSIEYALSGKEVLRRLQGDAPPDIVVLGKLKGASEVGDLVNDATKLDSRWSTRFIVLQDGTSDARFNSYVTTCLRPPFTEHALCGAIQYCLQSAS